MTTNELIKAIIALLPDAELGEDEEGQLIIYTGLEEGPNETVRPLAHYTVLLGDNSIVCAECGKITRDESIVWGKGPNSLMYCGVKCAQPKWNGRNESDLNVDALIRSTMTDEEITKYFGADTLLAMGGE